MMYLQEMYQLLGRQNYSAENSKKKKLFFVWSNKQKDWINCTEQWRDVIK